LIPYFAANPSFQVQNIKIQAVRSKMNFNFLIRKAILRKRFGNRVGEMNSKFFQCYISKPFIECSDEFYFQKKMTPSGGLQF
jgi:hypothetical protein